MRILIIEDELPAQRLLAHFVKEVVPAAELGGVFGSVKESTEWLLENEHPEIIFMDIQLSDGLCFQILEQCPPDSFVIFTTAYDQYALQAFKTNAIDYLLKPIRKEQVKAAIEKAKKQAQLAGRFKNNETDFSALADMLKQFNPAHKERIMVSSAKGWYKINVDEIAFFLLENKITYAMDFEENRHPIDMNLNQLTDSLNPKLFYRVNRQFILNIKAVEQVEPWFHGKLLVKTRPSFPEKITVAREKAFHFKEHWLNL